MKESERVTEKNQTEIEKKKEKIFGFVRLFIQLYLKFSWWIWNDFLKYSSFRFCCLHIDIILSTESSSWHFPRESFPHTCRMAVFRQQRRWRWRQRCLYLSLLWKVITQQNLENIERQILGILFHLVHIYHRYRDVNQSIHIYIYEHMRDKKIGDVKNALVTYNLETNHNFNFKDYKMVVNIHNKQHRKIVEFIIISKYNTMKQRNTFSTFLLI